MSRLSALAGLVFALALASSSAAQDDWYEQDGRPHSAANYESGSYSASRGSDDPTGLGIAMRLGYGVPMGKLVDAAQADFDELSRGSVDTQFDLNYAITPSWVVGGYLGLGFGILPSAQVRACDRADASCSLFFLRMGLDGEYRILPSGVVSPWLGANFGLEWAFQSVDGGSVEASQSLFGLLFGATVGLDVPLGRWGIGPFFSFQTGPYLSGDSVVETSFGDLSGSGKIEQRAFHHWLQFGARARYQFAN